MFGFNKSNKPLKRWTLDDYELIDTTIGKAYPFKKLFAAFNEVEELTTIWFNNQFLATLSCEKRVFDSILGRGVRQCSDFIFPFKTSDFSNDKTSIVFSGCHLLIDNKPHELSQLVLTKNENNELLICEASEQLATIPHDKKEEFMGIYQCALDNLTKKMTGESLAIFEAETNKEKSALLLEQQKKEEALKYAKAEAAGFPDILLTTESASPFKVKKRLGIVSAEYVHRVKLLQQFMAELSSIGEQRSSSTQRALKQAKETVLLELRREAYLLGADAVIAVDMDYSEISGAGDPLLFLVANGTAVTTDEN